MNNDLKTHPTQTFHYSHWSKPPRRSINSNRQLLSLGQGVTFKRLQATLSYWWIEVPELAENSETPLKVN